MLQTRTDDPRNGKPLSILHCLRAPVGGLFRHVVDLATAQAALGHKVGVICATGGDTLTEGRLFALSPLLTLGLHRLDMGRDIGFGDVAVWRQVVALARRLKIDVLHGHGAKGGAYARLAARSLKRSGRAIGCFYTPHGGSLHYPPTTLQGRFYRMLERRLQRFTDGHLFESQFAADRYAAQIGAPTCASQVVVNGLHPAEFEPVLPNSDAADFVFVGELRLLKGVDVALEALAALPGSRKATAVFVGHGPDVAAFKGQTEALGIASRVSFPGALPARDAFALGRVLLMPSRAESLPYVVLEAIAAGLPIIATNVGGIPEIIPSTLGPLVPPGDVMALSQAMSSVLAHPEEARARAIALNAAIRQKFTVAAMATGVTEFYLASQHLRQAA